MKTEEARKEKRSILTFLVGKGMREAQYSLAMLLCREDADYQNGAKLFALAALQGDIDSAHGAAMACKDLGKYSRAHFWSNVVVKAKGEGMNPECREKRMEDID